MLFFNISRCVRFLFVCLFICLWGYYVLCHLLSTFYKLTDMQKKEEEKEEQKVLQSTNFETIAQNTLIVYKGNS